MSRVSVKGLVVGALWILVLDTLTGIGMLALIGSDAIHEGMSERQLHEAVVAVMATTSFLVGSLILGTLSTVVGAYTAARTAMKGPYVNAAILGVAGMALGVLMVDGLPFWFNLLAFIFVLPAALLGGHLACSRTEARA
jgi:hypothetical protein